MSADTPSAIYNILILLHKMQSTTPDSCIVISPIRACKPIAVFPHSPSLNLETTTNLQPCSPMIRIYKPRNLMAFAQASQVLHIVIIQQGRISAMRFIDAIISHIKFFVPDVFDDAMALIKGARIGATSAIWASTSGKRCAFVTCSKCMTLETSRG